jgi:hypothetical protein
MRDEGRALLEGGVDEAKIWIVLRPRILKTKQQGVSSTYISMQ